MLWILRRDHLAPLRGLLMKTRYRQGSFFSVILYMYKDIELKIKPCHFILIGGTTQSNRLSTHADSVTIDQKSSLPACISCPTLRKNVGRNVLKNPLLRVRFYVFWYYSCKILKSVERELRDLFPGICSYRDRVTVAPWKS